MAADDAVVARGCAAASEDRDRAVAGEAERRDGDAAARSEPLGVVLAEVVPVGGVEPTHAFAVPLAVRCKRPRLVYLASSFPYGRNDVFFGPEVRELRRQGVDVLAVPVRPRGALTNADAAALAVPKPLLD